MKSAKGADLPIAEVAAALRKTTETLAHELAQPSSVPPLWSEFEWRIARAAAAMHGVSSLLCAGLTWAGPEDWRHFLLEQRDQCVARHLQIERLLDAIDSHAREAGIALVALKGAALCARGVYACGQRPMADLDLLVRKDEAKAAARLLEACGYEAAFAGRRHEVFQPRIRKPLPGEWLGRAHRYAHQCRGAHGGHRTPSGRGGGHHGVLISGRSACRCQRISLIRIPPDAPLAACRRKHAGPHRETDPAA